MTPIEFENALFLTPQGRTQCAPTEALLNYFQALSVGWVEECRRNSGLEQSNPTPVKLCWVSLPLNPTYIFRHVSPVGCVIDESTAPSCKVCGACSPSSGRRQKAVPMKKGSFPYILHPTPFLLTQF